MVEASSALLAALYEVGVERVTDVEDNSPFSISHDYHADETLNAP